VDTPEKRARHNINKYISKTLPHADSRCQSLGGACGDHIKSLSRSSTAVQDGSSKLLKKTTANIYSSK